MTSSSNTSYNDINNVNIDIFDIFWNDNIWNINTNSLKNKEIIKIFNQIKKYENEFNEDKLKFNINQFYDFEIKDNKKNIKKKINKFKKDNLNYLKTHADFFYEYHLLINQYFEKKNFMVENIDLSNTTNITNKIKITEELIQEHFELFKIKILDSNDSDIINKNNNIVSKLQENIIFFTPFLINYINNLSDKNKTYMILDTENILKSFKIQNEIKNHISDKDYNKYFKLWYNGLYVENENIDSDMNLSLSEYTSKINYIEPFLSLGINLESKIKLMKIILKNNLSEFNTINILTSNIKKKTNINIQSTNIFLNNNNINSFQYEKSSDSIIEKSINSNITMDTDENNNIFFSILYNKYDIREQDDHLILFIYTLLKKYDYNIFLITNDKYKWYNDINSIQLMNFKYLYDFDNNKVKLIIDKAYEPDIYKISNINVSFHFINTPFIDVNKYNNSLINLNIEKIDLKKISYFNYLSDTQIDIIYNKFIYFIINDQNSESNLYWDKIIEYIITYSNYLKKSFDIIFNFIKQFTKKEIFKISIEKNNNYFTSEQITNLLIVLNKYKYLIDIFIYTKIIQYKYFKSDKDKILKNIIFYSIIIEIYDEIYTNLYKIRKLSNPKSSFGNLFSQINTIYIYIKKQGFLKKNIL
jgi:hypothetical protein